MCNGSHDAIMTVTADDQTDLETCLDVTATANHLMGIAEFHCGGEDLVLERTGRPGRARLCRASASGLVPVAELRYDPATGALTDHWERSPATEDLKDKVIAAWVADAVPVLVAWSEQISTPAYRSRQRQAIEDLAQFRHPVADATDALAAVEPAAEIRYFLTRIELCRALYRQMSGELSADDLQQWARTYYERPDAGGELDHYEAIGRVLRAIAEPGTNPYLSLDRPYTLLRALDLVGARWYQRPSVLGSVSALAYAGAPMLYGGEPLPLPVAAGIGLAAAHACRYAIDRVRFGRGTALAVARREALICLPLCLAVMTAEAAS